MKRTSHRLSLIAATLIVAGACIAGQSQRLLVRVPIPERASLQRLQDLDLDFAYQGLKDYVDLVVDEQQLGILKERGFTYQLLPAIDRARLFDPAYHTYEQMVAYLDSLQREYPEISAVHQIGASEQLHIPIYAIKISDNAALDEDEFTV
ncbi:MAG: hypothetical protein H5U38_12115, partial [Calditrichaeota bacterium]|nr:hypothetical protein [Calditrichota bacterium]